MANITPVQLSLIVVLLITMTSIIAAVYGDSRVLMRLMDGTVRQPEVKDALFTNALVSCGLVESIPIIAIVVVLILIFANPCIA